jgi:hypothetical protein
VSTGTFCIKAASAMLSDILTNNNIFNTII